MSLNDTMIRSLKPKPTAYKVADERGLFLLVTPAGGKLWKLKFRNGLGVEKKLALGAYLFDLARDPARAREVSGRHGNDFIALGIDPVTREVVRFIAGEAKWRATLTPSAMEELMHGEWTGPPGARVRKGDGIWNEMNRGLAAPQGLEQLNSLLCEKAREDYAEAIVSLDRALLLGAAALPRTDLIFVAGNKAARRAPGQSYLPTDAPPADYTAGRPLQVVELVVEGGVGLIDGLYTSLWDGR